MRDVINFFTKYPPDTLYDCMAIVGKFGLCGQGGGKESPVQDFFVKNEKTIDQTPKFW